MTDPDKAPPAEETRGPASPVVHPAPSPRQRIVLAVAVTAFLLWLGYLGFLAVATGHPIVLSRPQILASNLIVLAQLTGEGDHPNALVKVEQVIWPKAPPELAKKTILVKNLEQISGDQGWNGAGEYILALTSHPSGPFGVTPIPPSPGFAATARPQADRLRIYPAEPSALEQLADIQRQFQRE